MLITPDTCYSNLDILAHIQKPAPQGHSQRCQYPPLGSDCSCRESFPLSFLHFAE